ncbi:C4-dicarboxylate transport system (Permease small protein) (fragment) [uncultured Pleomorphomonas sp.]|uniref:TRAP transporter small permease protein n=1 Tax=uncultured Pleomorphomonas sp. TaxID=442121 RepID=A0A212LGA4_9HYPH
MKLLIGLEKNFEKYLITGALLVMSLVLIAQVVMRYVFRSPFIWSEELSRYLLIWLSMMGTSLAVRESRHISVDFLPVVFGPRSYALFATIAHVGNLVFCTLMIWYAVPVIVRLAAIGQMSPSLGIPMWLIYAAVPVGLTFMALRTIQALWLLAASGAWRSAPIAPETSGPSGSL